MNHQQILEMIKIIWLQYPKIPDIIKWFFLNLKSFNHRRSIVLEQLDKNKLFVKYSIYDVFNKKINQIPLYKFWRYEKELKYWINRDYLSVDEIKFVNQKYQLNLNNDYHYNQFYIIKPLKWLFNLKHNQHVLILSDSKLDVRFSLEDIYQICESSPTTSYLLFLKTNYKQIFDAIFKLNL